MFISTLMQCEPLTLFRWMHKQGETLIIVDAGTVCFARRRSKSLEPIDEANVPLANNGQRACHAPRAWLISFSLGMQETVDMKSRVKSFTVGLPVADLKRAVEWYRRLLGQVEELDPAPGVCEFQIISSGWLQLFEGEANGSNQAVVRFESGDLEANRVLAVSLGTDVGEIKTAPEAVRYFEFRDPFGNRLSFYELLA
jgi:predicted enzyme related to lactoylglutathione lyase